MGLTDSKRLRHFEYSDLMYEYWLWFQNNLSHYDFAFFLGDLVEGEGRHETTFHLTTDVSEQIDMAVDIIKMINAKKNVFVYGTAYHTGKIMDYENQIAKEFGGDIAAYKKISVDGVRFDLSHDIGKSGTPTGGDIALKKEMLWTWLYDLMESGRTETADYILRGHAHEYRGVFNETTTAIICPALKIGIPDLDRYARKVKGWYTVGFMECEIIDGKANMTPKLFKYQIKMGGYEKYETS